MSKHGCIKHMLRGYLQECQDLSEKDLLKRVEMFGPGGAWEGRPRRDGTPRGGDYDTNSWRLYKIAHIQEAHRRGIKLGT